MVDSHCHLQDFQDAEILGFQEAGLTMICNGAGVESSRRAVEIAERFENVYATVGIHPEEMPRDPSTSVGMTRDELLEMTKRPRVVAIGECGLDYGAHLEGGREEQRALFRFNIELAKETGLPLVVHCRNAFEDAYQVLSTQNSGLRGMMHCWTGNMEWMKKFVDLGWYISFGGILTFKSSHELREVANMVPEDQLLVETDAPWLAPEPVRGTKNTPANVKIIIDKLSDVRRKDMSDIVSQNAKRLFDIP